jgi:hypothetical protein
MSDPIRMWRYYLPNVNGEGWAEIILCSSGFFGAVSDYGDYAFAWRRPARGDECIRRFMLDIGPDYVRGKIAPREEYDGARSVRAVRKCILDERRRERMTREEALREWWLIGQHGDLNRSEHFALWCQETQIADAYELARHAPDQDAAAFCENVLPRLKDAIRSEIAAEAPAV